MAIENIPLPSDSTEERSDGLLDNGEKIKSLEDIIEDNELKIEDIRKKLKAAVDREKGKPRMEKNI